MGSSIHGTSSRPGTLASGKTTSVAAIAPRPSPAQRRTLARSWFTTIAPTNVAIGTRPTPKATMPAGSSLAAYNSATAGTVVPRRLHTRQNTIAGPRIHRQCPWRRSGIRASPAARIENHSASPNGLCGAPAANLNSENEDPNKTPDSSRTIRSTPRCAVTECDIPIHILPRPGGFVERCLRTVSGASGPSGVAAHELSGLMDTEEVPHNQVK